MHKLSVVLILVAFSLVLYAATIVTDLFGSSFFGPLQFISHDVAHGVVLYDVAVAAIFLSLGALGIDLFDELKMRASIRRQNLPLPKANRAQNVSTQEEPASPDLRELISYESVSGNILCRHCMREFKEPAFSVSYVGSLPKIVLYCPYCKQPVVLE